MAQAVKKVSPLSIRIEEPGHPSTRLGEFLYLKAWLQTTEASRDQTQIDLLLEEKTAAGDGSFHALVLHDTANSGRPFVESLERVLVDDVGSSQSALTERITGRIPLAALIPETGQPARVFRLTLAAKSQDEFALSNTVEFAVQPKAIWAQPFGGFLFPDSALIASDELILQGWALKQGDSVKRVEVFINNTFIGDAIYGVDSPALRMSLPDPEESDAGVFLLRITLADLKRAGVSSWALRVPLRIRARCSFNGGEQLEFETKALRWKPTPSSNGESIEGAVEEVRIDEFGMIRVSGWLYTPGYEKPRIYLEARDRVLELESGKQLEWLHRGDVEDSHLARAYQRDYGFQLVFPPHAVGRFPGQIRIVAINYNGRASIPLGSKQQWRKLSKLVADNVGRIRFRDQVFGLTADLLTHAGIRSLVICDAPPELTPILNKKPHILIATHNLSAVEGAPKVLFSVVEALVKSKKDCALTVVSACDGPLSERLRQLGVRVEVIPELSAASQTWERYGQGTRKLYELCREIQPTGVYANVIDSFWGIELARHFSIPAIWAIHESVSPELALTHLDARLRIQFLDHLRHCEQFVFVTEQTAELFRASIGSGTYTVIPNGIDIEAIDNEKKKTSREQARRELAVTDDTFVVTIVGTTTHRKGQDIFLRELALLKARLASAPLKAYIVGARTGPFLDKLRQTIKANNLETTVELIFETPSVSQFYLASDVLVVASRQESAPLVSLEAFAYGVPLVSTTVFGLAEQIADKKNALAFDAEVEGALADALEFLRDKPERRELLAEQARQDVEQRFSLPNAMRQYEELFGQVFVFKPE